MGWFLEPTGTYIQTKGVILTPVTHSSSHRALWWTADQSRVCSCLSLLGETPAAPVHDGKVLVYVAEADLCHGNKIISLLTAFVYDMESIKMLLTLLAEFYFIYEESKALGGGVQKRREEKRRKDVRGGERWVYRGRAWGERNIKQLQWWRRLCRVALWQWHWRPPPCWFTGTCFIWAIISSNVQTMKHSSALNLVNWKNHLH